MERMKVVVDFDLCESNAVCMGIVPDVFEVREDDFLYVLDEHPPEELRLITCGGALDTRSGHYQDNVVAYARLVRVAN